MSATSSTEGRSARTTSRVLAADRSARRRGMGAGVACFVLLGLTAAALALVAVLARHLDVALALGQEQKLQAKLLEEKRRLENDIARLKEPGRISAIARERLHMAAVDPHDIRVLRPAAGRSP